MKEELPLYELEKLFQGLLIRIKEKIKIFIIFILRHPYSIKNYFIIVSPDFQYKKVIVLNIS
jgi:hypothetical protein